MIKRRGQKTLHELLNGIPTNAVSRGGYEPSK